MGKWNQDLKSRIEEKSIPVTECGCWIWLGSKYANGYGGIGINKKSTLAHRASWMAFRGKIPNGFMVLHFRGKIPNGFMVLHRCDNRFCVNPDHLFLGNHLDNMLDRDKKGRNKPRPGILNPKAKLTEKDVIEIRASKLTPTKLAKQYGISRGNVHRIKNRKYWKCVPETNSN